MRVTTDDGGPDSLTERETFLPPADLAAVRALNSGLLFIITLFAIYQAAVIKKIKNAQQVI